MLAQEIVSKLYQEGVLVTSDILQQIKAGKSYDDIIKAINPKENEQVNTTNSQNTSQNTQSQSEIDKHVRVKVVRSTDKESKEITVQDFIDHFSVRLQKLTAILRQRSELENVMSISRVLQKDQSEKVSIIGLVQDFV